MEGVEAGLEDEEEAGYVPGRGRTVASRVAQVSSGQSSPVLDQVWKRLSSTSGEVGSPDLQQLSS